MHAVIIVIFMTLNVIVVMIMMNTMIDDDCYYDRGVDYDNVGDKFTTSALCTTPAIAKVLNL